MHQSDINIKNLIKYRIYWCFERLFKTNFCTSKNKESFITQDMFLKRPSLPCFLVKSWHHFDPKCHRIANTQTKSYYLR